MKICVIQPPYSVNYADSAALFAWELAELDACDPTMDMIVLPEYSNVPALAKTREQMLASYTAYAARLWEKAAETARRCQAVVFVNGIDATETGLRNTTVVFGRDGQVAGKYYKQHLVPSEMGEYRLDKDYTYEHSEPTILTVDGVRYGFLICYDFYFYEAFANLARYNPDVIVACAYMRSDSHDTLEMLAKFCAYNCNAYLVRSSVSLGAESPVGGCSMVVSPEGKTLMNMKNEVGHRTVEIDPHAHYLKAAGYGNPPTTHHAYIEAGRRPWKYRPGGSAIVLPDAIASYPRVCAHRGFSSVAPENSLPALGAAVAMGADEVEFDLWAVKDGTVVSIHDPVLDRVSNGRGFVWDHTYEELLRFDFGTVFDAEFAGLRIPTFEDILRKFACHTVMNVHIKHTDNVSPLPEATLREILRLIDKYDCRKYVYFMSGNPAILKQLQTLAPDICRCAGAGDSGPEELVDKALAADCKKIQLYKPHLVSLSEDELRALIDRAHAHGLICNFFYADDPVEAERYFSLGVDTVLTNRYWAVSRVLETEGKR